MTSPKPNQEKTTIQVSKATAQKLKDLFPSASYEEAILWLANRYESGLGDLSACANTELWIKLDRLEETLSLLALTNMDVADLFRRLAAMELPLLHKEVVRLAGLAEAKMKGEQ